MTDLTEYRLPMPPDPLDSVGPVVVHLSTEECEVAAGLLDSIACGVESAAIRAAAGALSARLRSQLD